MSALAFVLAFGDTENKEWISYSELSKNSYTSEFALGEDYLPHATIVQFRGSVGDANMIWKEATSKGLNGTIEVVAAGMCFLPAPDNSEVWIEVPFLKSEALSQLQDSLLGLDSLAGREILNGCGDSFRPHVTLGYTSEEAVLRVSGLDLPGSLLRRKFTARVALADTGPHYSVPRILHG
ncbi:MULTISPECIES: hypothetical protein [unclassified Ruegeria]|uniref:hypothetical protein n=1 Tax=unclassified Ruegeria TaxID=2625375 RepID=UPI001489766B|nr:MULTISPECIES: hypothetical protein [unclassified Ruegeria]NOD85912.1 hypothetical protein [Ruegeria sp. HKCCD6119]